MIRWISGSRAYAAGSPSSGAGAAALAAYQAGETLDEAFVEKHAPRVLKAIEIFGEFLYHFFTFIFQLNITIFTVF